MSIQEPTVRASVLVGFDRFLTARGVDAAKLFRDAGLPLAAIANPENKLSINSVMAVMNEAAQATGDPCLGLSFAEQFPVGGTGVLGYLIKNSSTVDEALSTVAHFAGLLGQPFDVHYDKDDEGALLWWCWPSSVIGPKDQYTSFALALLLFRVRYMTREDWEPVFVEMPHERLACKDKAKRIFGENIHYNAERAAIRVDMAALNGTFPKADGLLKPILQKFGERLIAEEPASHGVASEAAAIIRVHLPDRLASLEFIAGKLGHSPRALQTMLADEATTFENLLNDTRKLRAEELLKDTDLPLTDIAIMLGFSELSSFTRAAQRWFAAAPSAHRQKLRSVSKDEAR